MKTTYFTYGTDEKYPYHGGWTRVVTDENVNPVEIFKQYHPNRVGSPFVNCAVIYSEEEFKKTEMYKDKDNLGFSEHEVINCYRIGI